MLTVSRLLELIDYNPETGVFTSRITCGRCGRWPAGRRLGSLGVNGYRTIWIDGKHRNEHRVAVAWMTGAWPEEEVDHINLDRSDNRWANLRVATRGENCLNNPGRPNRRVGRFKGVTPYMGRWKAQIGLNRQVYHLGCFDTQEQAHAAYIAASERLHGERGRVKESQL